MRLFLAQQLHDISPPVDYSLVPVWLVFAAALVALTLLGIIGWWVYCRTQRPKPPQSARSRALAQLQRARAELSNETPYEFSIRVSDILRGYVTEQYHLPVTRQTSVEFLETLTQTASFSDDERSLLTDFLNRCDLIKFARYDASITDSERLLEEASRFVQGGQLEPVA